MYINKSIQFNVPKQIPTVIFISKCMTKMVTRWSQKRKLSSSAKFLENQPTLIYLDTDSDGEITYEEFKAMHGRKDHMDFA